MILSEMKGKRTVWKRGDGIATRRKAMLKKNKKKKKEKDVAQA